MCEPHWALHTECLQPVLACWLLAVHCGSIRQTATILSMDKDCLRTGDKATVHFRFIKTPEYLHIDQRLVFREGRTKAVGTITKVGHPRHLESCGTGLTRGPLLLFPEQCPRASCPGL